MAKEACAANNWLPEYDENRKAFAGWAARTWNWYYYPALNDLLPPEKCKIKLTAEEKRIYLERLEALKEERKKNPNIPIGYGPVELETE